MRKYETVYIVNSDLDEEALKVISEKYSEQVKTLGGEVEDIDIWGKKRFAYEIDGIKEGNYIVMRFNSTVSTSQELGRILKLSDEVIKTHIVKLN